jgi:uncharacterized ion transporter superfamily protein YfcC
LSFFLWPLYCLSFLDLRLLNIALAFSILFMMSEMGKIKSDLMKKGQKDREWPSKHNTENHRSNPTKTRGWTFVLVKGKEFLLHMWHMSCYSCYIPSDMSWMRKGLDCDYNKWVYGVFIES